MQLMRCRPPTTMQPRAGARRSAAAVLLLAAVAAGCRPDTGPPEILVSAASDLAATMPDLVQAFEAAAGVRATVTIGSTGQLASQIEHGAPVDVFLAADAQWVDRLEAAGRIDPESRAVYAFGTLVLLAGRQPAPPAAVAELADERWARIAIANPEHAPYGRAARQALERAGVYDSVAPRLIYGENVRQATQFAESGAVDVALVALALMDSARHRWAVVPAALHDPLVQTAAVVTGSGNAAAARAFVEFLVSDTGRSILQRRGFILP
jgi:molybdate transport system substrate-binding protein